MEKAKLTKRLPISCIVFFNDRYNPMTDKWTQIAPLTFPCRSCTMVAAGDKLLVRSWHNQWLYLVFSLPKGQYKKFTFALGCDAHRYAFRNGQGNAMQRTAAVYNPTVNFASHWKHADQAPTSHFPQANEWTPFGGNPYGCNQGLAAASVHV